ncbi:unnamed protein product [Pleuronectes platessa]|uniref:Uncharacterized protein n=1 Tax=Pleuronectes platessa TaxID=8262 RepID=A0A9N7Z925_PLEPL|nr:unnamed protein product [Pleuronectes platessa]
MAELLSLRIGSTCGGELATGNTPVYFLPLFDRLPGGRVGKMLARQPQRHASTPPPPLLERVGMPRRRVGDGGGDRRRTTGRALIHQTESWGWRADMLPSDGGPGACGGLVILHPLHCAMAVPNVHLLNKLPG